MEIKIEYAIASVTTGKVFPQKKFDTYDGAEEYRLKRPDPSHWKIVRREVTYGEWK